MSDAHRHLVPVSAPRRAWHRMLRTPLLTKIIVLDLSIDIAAFAALKASPPEYSDELTLLSMAVVLVLNAALVAWALSPLRVLEGTANRVANGEFGARTVMPTLADRNLVRIGIALDLLLDRLEHERARVRGLAQQVVVAGERERARIARELHDGTAQSLSALDMLITATLPLASDTAVAARIQTMKDIAGEALVEVRALSHTVHPRVLDDLGLPAALRRLARRTRETSGVAVSVKTDGPVSMPSEVASTLYRVAQEATHNAVKHSGAEGITLYLRVHESGADLTIEDNGRGFQIDTLPSASGMGLFVMEERVSLVDGTFSIRSASGGGTTIRANVPFTAGDA